MRIATANCQSIHGLEKCNQIVPLSNHQQVICRSHTVTSYITYGTKSIHGLEKCNQIYTVNTCMWAQLCLCVNGFWEVRSDEANCPCAAHPSTEPLTPDYVGDHYYCDTATYYEPKRKWYTNNTQWDGKDCYPGSKCCDNERLPWFWRTLPQETSDDVEVRWCTSHGIGNAKVSTELLGIFVH